MQYESAHKRRDGGISREGSVALRRAWIDLDMGLWLNEPAAKRYAHELKDRGFHGGVAACGLAHRANLDRPCTPSRPCHLRTDPLGLNP